MSPQRRGSGGQGSSAPAPQHPGWTWRQNWHCLPGNSCTHNRDMSTTRLSLSTEYSRVLSVVMTRQGKTRHKTLLVHRVQQSAVNIHHETRQNTRLSLSTEYSRVLSTVMTRKGKTRHKTLLVYRVRQSAVKFTTRQGKTRHKTLLVYRVQQSAVNSHDKTRQDKTQGSPCLQSTAACCQW